jgi:hypothetical protein
MIQPVPALYTHDATPQKTEAALATAPLAATPWFSVIGAAVDGMMAARCFRSISIAFRMRGFVLRAGDTSARPSSESPSEAHLAADCPVLGVCIIMPMGKDQSSGRRTMRLLTKNSNDVETHTENLLRGGIGCGRICRSGSLEMAPRSGLGWEIDHFAGYFVITLMFALRGPGRL